MLHRHAAAFRCLLAAVESAPGRTLRCLLANAVSAPEKSLACFRGTHVSLAEHAWNAYWQHQTAPCLGRMRVAHLPLTLSHDRLFYHTRVLALSLALFLPKCAGYAPRFSVRDHRTLLNQTVFAHAHAPAALPSAHLPPCKAPQDVNPSQRWVFLPTRACVPIVMTSFPLARCARVRRNCLDWQTAQPYPPLLETVGHIAA